MTDTGAGLVAAIVDHPGDDLPRLALADWLDDQGDAEGARRLRLPGRWWFFTRTAAAGVVMTHVLCWGHGSDAVTVDAVSRRPRCSAGCPVGWGAGVAVGGRWWCWGCGAWEAGRTATLPPA